MTHLQTQGYQIVPDLYTKNEVDQILSYIKQNIPQEQFGLREFITKHTQLKPILFNIIACYRRFQIRWSF